MKLLQKIKYITRNLSWFILGFWLLAALFAPILATHYPWAVKYKGELMFPAFAVWWQADANNVWAADTLNYAQTNWRELDTEYIVWAPIPYSPEDQDKLNSDYVSPGMKQQMLDENRQAVPSTWRFRHHLGTNLLGQDVLSILLHGARTALYISFFAVLLAGFIGLVLGLSAGYFGDFDVRLSIPETIGLFISIPLFVFLAFIAPEMALADAAQKGLWELLVVLGKNIAMGLGCMLLFQLLLRWMSDKLLKTKRKWFLPIDNTISRFTEIIHSLPKLLLIIVGASLFKERSLNAVIIIIGLTAWTSVARYARAEALKIRQLEYVLAAKALNFSTVRILFRHVLPNAIGPVWVELAFLFASAVLLESSLSFLGLGIPEDLNTWGTLLNQGRLQFDAWWLVVFPGLSIASLVWALNHLGLRYRNKAGAFNVRGAN